MKKQLSTCIAVLIVLSTLLTAYASPVTVLKDGQTPAFHEDAELMKIYVFKIYARDCILVQCGGKNMLIDCGEMSYGELYIAPALKALGVDHIDYAVNTHPDDDHIGGFFTLVDLIPIDTYYTCFPEDYCVLQTQFLELARSKGIQVEQITRETDLSFGGISIWTFQDLTYPDSPNGCSLVMHMTYGDSKAIFLADIPYDVHHSLASEKREALKADIIKTPHHGCNTPCYDLMDYILPEYGVITHWRHKYTKGTASVLAHYQCAVGYSAEGIIECVTDGREWQVCQHKP